MKIAVLTSSRAEYGIYKPFLRLAASDKRCDLHLIVFGMHLLEKFGNTIEEVESDKYGFIHLVYGMPESDEPAQIALGYGELIKSFSLFWAKNSFDWVVALGDRFEMSAAVQASIPYEVRIAHLHGGETSLGAVDNIYRHQISHASKFHFVATAGFKRKLESMLGSSEGIHHVGALSLDGIEDEELPDWQDVANKFDIPETDFILITIHPETVGKERNVQFLSEVRRVFETLCVSQHLVITMPNADTMGSLYRSAWIDLKTMYPGSISLVESFGRINYFIAMKMSSFMLGNTSSGIIEAASFKKWVVNIGDRQKGRLQSSNVINTAFDFNEIMKAIESIKRRGDYDGKNVYSKPNTARNIIETLYEYA